METGTVHPWPPAKRAAPCSLSRFCLLRITPPTEEQASSSWVRFGRDGQEPHQVGSNRHLGLK